MEGKIEVKHVFILLTCFWVVWLYSEISAHYLREDLDHNMIHFMQQGGRNTNEMGYRLCKRVAHLELEHHNLKGESCEKIYHRDNE